jgi:rod shape determining protein RodA
MIMVVDWKFWRTFSYPIYALTLIPLSVVWLIGVKINGARAWFGFGSFTIQPAEFVKFATTLALSSYLSVVGTNIHAWKTQATTLGIVGIPIFFIALQPDVGSILVFLAFLVPLYREGLSPIPYVLGFVIAILFIITLIFGASSIVLFLLFLFSAIMLFNMKADSTYWIMGLCALGAGAIWGSYNNLLPQLLIGATLLYLAITAWQWLTGKTQVISMLFVFSLVCFGFSYSTNYAFENILKPHHQERINAWLNPAKCDPRGALYNVIQSKMAIGSGGFWGKGFLQGTMTKLNYVPEQSTDFIFCTMGEEQGFVGSLLVIGLFIALLYRIVIIAERQRSNFSRIYMYSVAGILFIHFFINIGMTLSLIPVIGIPLPFLSKGGSSLLGFTLLIGVMLKMDSDRYSV